MPRIIVTADWPTDGGDRPVMFTERVSASDFGSEHFRTQLAERLGWAVGDAAAVEQSGLVPGTTDSAPEPVETAIGMKPRLATKAVMSTGRRRVIAPSRTACRIAAPSALRLLM